MMTETRPQQAAAAHRPGTVAALCYLLLSFPSGVFWFTLLITLAAVGLGTAVVWVGVPLLVLTLLLTRGAGRLERGRANVLLGTDIRPPYRPLPEGLRAGVRARLRDPATWRDFGYTLSLLPLGVVEFGLTVALWSAGLNFVALPFYYPFLPEGSWGFPNVAGDGPRWVVVDSLGDAMPWMALGVLICLLAVLVTRGLGTWHARYASRALAAKGPNRGY